MIAQHVRLLYGFNAWANQRALNACAPLTADQFTRDLGSSFPSVRDTLVHILGGEIVWLARWKGGTPTGLEPAANYSTFDSVRARLTEIDNELADFASRLDDEKIASILNYRTTEGKPFSNTSSQMLQHLANHGAYHRGQVTTMLRQLGAKSTAMDLIFYFREAGAKPVTVPYDAEDVHLQCEFNSWANRRILESCASLANEKFTRDLHSSFPSIRDTLAHMMEVEWIYLERWHGRSPGGPPEGRPYADLASLAARWQGIERSLNSFAVVQTEDTLAERVDYRNTKGDPYANALWEMMVHLILHSSYHRGQVATMLRQSGSKALGTDLIAFFRQRAAQATA